MQDHKFYTLLTLAGTLPFIECALLPLLGIDSISPLGNLHALANSYGLAIICFLSGAQWGTYLSGGFAGSLNLFVVSNAIFLTVWFAFIGANFAWAISIQAIAFLLLLVIDYRLREGGAISAHYFRIRGAATGIAVVALLIILLSQ
jgi:hypothetical protein